MLFTMKKNYLLLVLAISILFTCGTKEDGLRADRTLNYKPNPNIISQYHILSQSGEISEKYTFDNYGNISTYRKMANDFEIHYVFDSIFKLTQVVKKDLRGKELAVIERILYDSNNRVTKINDRYFDYNEDQQYYIDLSTYGFYESTEQSKNPSTSELFYNRYDVVKNNPMPVICYYEKYVKDKEVVENCNPFHNIGRLSYTNKNLDWYGTYNNPTRFSYNNKKNPLFFKASNLPYISGFLFNGGTVEFPSFKLISVNNRNFVQQGKIDSPIEDQEKQKFTYTLNNLGLPIKGFVQPYLNAPSGPKIEYSKYYYQGDDIPYNNVKVAIN